MTVIEKSGHVTMNGSPTVETVVLTVERDTADGARNLSNMTIDWFGPTGHTTLTYSGETQTETRSQPVLEFTNRADANKDTSHPHLNTTQNRVTIALHAAAITEDRGLAAGTTVALKFTTPTGATHFLTLEVPESLHHQSKISL